MRRLSLLVLTTLMLTTVAMASPAKTAGRTNALTPPVTTAGQAATAELMCVQTPKEVVFTVNDENTGACLATIGATGQTTMDFFYDVGKTDVNLGTVAEASVNNRMRTGIDTLDAYDGCLNGTGKTAALLLDTCAALAIPMSNYAKTDINFAAGFHNASYRSIGEIGDRSRR